MRSNVTRQISIYLTPEEYALVRERCVHTGNSVARLGRRLLTEYLVDEGLLEHSPYGPLRSRKPLTPAA